MTPLLAQSIVFLVVAVVGAVFGIKRDAVTRRQSDSSNDAARFLVVGVGNMRGARRKPNALVGLVSPHPQMSAHLGHRRS